MGPIKFLHNSKFDFTASTLVTNTVVITRVLCIVSGTLKQQLTTITTINTLTNTESAVRTILSDLLKHV